MKRFLIRTLVGSIPLILLLLGALYYYIEVRPNLNGDLGQLGKITFSGDYDREIRRERVNDSLFSQYAPTEPVGQVVTIGDSFSQQLRNGYQAYLAGMLGTSVTNIPVTSAECPEWATQAMLDSGFFQNRDIRVVIVESVERAVANRCIALLDGNATTALPLSLKDTKTSGENPSQGGNDASLPAKILRQARDWALLNTGLSESPVKKMPLTKPVFSHKGKEDMLYFYKDDLGTLANGEESVSAMEQVIKNFSGRFGDKGILFIFMVAPDKYQVYQDLAADNSFPRTGFGDMLGSLSALPEFVNPIDTLRCLAGRGELDLYMADDTHWSYKSARLAASMLADRIRKSGVLDQKN